jgi:polar amino acid transport system substrate-binding protein
LDVNRIARHSITAAAVLLAALCSAAGAQDCVRTARWNDDAPYFVRGENGSIRGIDADLLTEVLRRIGCRPEFEPMPWARALVELEAGRVDVVTSAFRTPDRERFAYFSKPYHRSPNVLFVAVAQKGRIKHLSDIRNLPFRLGAQIGVAYGPEYDALFDDSRFASHLVPITDRRLAWEMISLDRLDGLIADESSAIIEIKSLGLEGAIQRSSVVVSTTPAMFAFSKRSVSPDFVARFNQALTDTLADGTYKTILERYLPCTVSASKLGCE